MARYEERSGRSVESLAWYQALAIWKAAVFMEGNYKAYAEGRSDDEYLGLFDEGVPALAEQARQIARDRQPLKGLLVDFGGVLTTNVFDSFRAFCQSEGLDADAFLKLMSEDSEARRQLRRVETGAISEDEFGVILAEKLGVSDSENLIDRLFAGMQADQPMIDAVEGGQGRGHPHRPGVQLDRRRPLRPLHLPRDVRRRGHLRRGGPAQAPARDLPAGRRARRRARPRSACSWTTCARTARAPRRWA